METKACSRCSQERGEADWAPSQWSRSKGGWCRPCSSQWHRDRYVPKNGVDDAPRLCKQCGASYRPKVRTASWFCSRACKAEARNEAAAAATLALKMNRPPCVQCGGRIGPERRSDLLTCSTRCQGQLRAAEGRSAKAHRRYRLKKNYGLTERDFDALLESQSNQCAICGTCQPRGRGWAVDHDHETGAVRGLLCGPCNTGIGQLGDDPTRLRAAADYIERFRSS